MKNKTLPILLVIPFVVAILAFVSVVALNNTVASDILGIDWAYLDTMAFKADPAMPIALEASPRIDESLILAPGNDLVWSVSELNGSSTEKAAVTKNNGSYFLYALEEGDVKVTCSNERGTVSRYFTATIFENGTITINDKRAISGNSVKTYRTYGMYDFVYNSLIKDSYSNQPATIEFDSTVYFETEIGQEVELVDKSSNLDYEDGKIIIKGAGDSYFTLASKEQSWIRGTYRFEVIDGAYNIYSYDDLLMATNLSSNGEKAVLQVNLESMKNTYVYAHGGYNDTKLKDNTSLMGHYDWKNKEFSFADDVYRFETTYNHEFIDQYNSQMGTNFKPEIISGIHVQKDFYGNGFTLNFHELAYPSHGSIGKNGKLMPGDEDLFKGPLPFVTIGPLEENFMVKALGQDNSGIYLDGNNITLDNVLVSNTNNTDDMYNLTYVGTVVDVYGQGNKITNSIIQNGKVAVRAFEADGFELDNCILRNACEFLLKVGSNDVSKPNSEKSVIYDVHNEVVNKSFNDFFGDTSSASGTANSIYSAFIGNAFGGREASSDNTYMQLIQKYVTKSYKDYSDDEMVQLLGYTQNALDNTVNFNAPHKMKVNDTAFYNSGIFSIALETSFNGGYLYSGLPTPIQLVTSILGGTVIPNMIGGTSRPIDLSIEGNTNFYDWKDVDSIDVSSLIDENISSIASSLAGHDINITIDDFFPIKSMLKESLKEMGCLYERDGKQYANTKIAYYGGGLNGSDWGVTSLIGENDFSSNVIVDLVAANIGNRFINEAWYTQIFAKAVIMATGTHPFKFVTNDVVGTDTPSLFGKAPTIKDLQDNYAKGASI